MNIKDWKSKYGKVMRMTLEGNEVYFRTLTCRELLQVKDKEDTAIKIVPDLVILNDTKLDTPGARSRLTTHVLQHSVIPDDDELQKKAILNRTRIKENFLMSLVARICSVFLSYKPEELMDKTVDQLLEIVAMAEVATDRHIILTGDEKLRNRMRTPDARPDGKFNEPNTEELMVDSEDALSKVMKKHGKPVKKLNEVKKENGPELNELQKQMKQLSEFD